LKQKDSVSCSFQDLDAALFLLVKYFYKHPLAAYQTLIGFNIWF